MNVPNPHHGKSYFQPHKNDEQDSRIYAIELDDRRTGWYFKTREGHFGPFPNEHSAQASCDSHVLKSQQRARAERRRWQP